MNPSTLPAVVAGYLQCAEWSSKPEGSSARFSAAARQRAESDCAAFIAECGQVAADAIATYGPARFGHDFWLTRAGHGVGFWDRDELSAEHVGPVPFTDRHGVPRVGQADTLGDALSIVAYGNHGSIGRFAYCDLYASRGWLYFA